MQSLISQNNNIHFIGIGGNKMIEKGLVSIEKMEKLSIIGFSEVIKHLRFFSNLLKRVLTNIEEAKPQHIILIDYPGFNLILAKKIKKSFNIPITYYISPQIWAWKENRIKIIKKYIDQMLVIFPFEENWYRKRGVNAKFVGHPIYNQWKPESKNVICNKLNLNINNPIITIYPGSRTQEVEKHLPILLSVCKKLKNKNKDIQFVLGVAKYIKVKKWIIPDWIYINKDSPQKALECADLALVASGTSTVEAAVFGTPMIIIYKMSPLTWWISKVLVKVKYAGMVNIIANSMIMPEILQSEATSKNIYNMAIKIISNKKILGKMQSDLILVQNLLKGSSQLKSASDYIIELDNKNEV
tara:strand:- start:750 stop:1817 length:1068 start_codon:yes stop_codon:yes gene_type:complete